MVKFKILLKKFGEMGEKTGWTYIHISSNTAQKLHPGRKTSFRVKGKLDDFKIEKTALIPIGKGDFVLPINASMRKGLKKREGDSVIIFLESDGDLEISADLLFCLEDEPAAKSFFLNLPPSHQRYYSNWINDAKTEVTKTKRIAQAISAFSKKLSYSDMMKLNKGKSI